MRSPTPDERRTARLLFADELAAGAASETDVTAAPEVLEAVRSRGVPALPRRVAQAAARKTGRLDAVARTTDPAVRARRAVLGTDAERPPRILLRMDEYPHWLAQREPDRFGDAAFAPWRDILAAAGCPHLVAVVPRIADDPEQRDGPSRDLLDAEVDRLHQLAADGVVFGLHGDEHRTRFRHPRLHTELGHRSTADLLAMLDGATARLERQAGIRTRVLVPPFNTFGARQWPALAARFDVITGGPESILRMGLAPTPSFRDGAVYLPAYPPLYGTAAEVLPALERLIDAGTGLWTPVVLHWGWEAHHGWKDLERLAERIAPYAAGWDDFLDAVEKNR